MKRAMKRAMTAATAAVLAVAGALCAGEGAEEKAAEAVVKNGLSLAAAAEKEAYRRREPVVLAVTLRNVGEAALTLSGMEFMGWRPTPGFVLVLKREGGKRTLRVREGWDPGIMAPARLAPKTLAAGEAVELKVKLDRWARLVYPPQKVVPRKRQMTHLGEKVLDPGAYEVTVEAEFGAGAGKAAGVWTGKLVSKPVAVKVLEEAAEGGEEKEPEADEGGKWVEACGGEGWYKGQEGKEEIFTGVLKANPAAERPSTLMRTHYYVLGEWRVFTGGRRVKALEKLVGRPVRILGKAVEMNLEGQHLKELWPNGVREVKPAGPMRMDAKPLGPGRIRTREIPARRK
jgi:hypothetical protein